MMINETETTLIDVIGERVLQCIGRLAHGSQNLNYNKLSQVLKEETGNAYAELIRDMKHADQTFVGHSDPILNQVMNVGCMNIAAKAWSRYLME